MGLPARKNFTTWAGDTFEHTFTMTTDGTTLIDTTGRTYAAQVRTQGGRLVVEFDVTNGGATGEITVSGPAATMDVAPGVYAWDLEETDGAVVTTLVAGTFTIKQDVSR